MPATRYEPRKEPRQRRSQVTFDAILEAAAQVLQQQGYVGTTTNAIAERAGVSIGSVYEYFPGKDAIFAALKRRMDEESYGFVLDQLVDTQNPEPADFLRQVLRARIGAALRRPELEAQLRAEIPASVLEDQAREVFELFDSGMRAFVSKNSDAVRVENLDAAILLGTAVVDLVVDHFAASDPDVLRNPDVVAAFEDMMTRWILKDPEGPDRATTPATPGER